MDRNTDFRISTSLIIVNLALFLWNTVTAPSTAGLLSEITPLQEQMVIAAEFLREGQWYRLVSAGFVHFGALHVAMNMILLYQLGRILEPVLGTLRFTLIYFASLLAGSAGAVYLTPDAYTGGASGAVFGLMAAAVVGLRQRGVNPMQTGLGVVFVINVLFTLAVPGVSVGGHFGGAIGGAACGVVLLARFRTPTWMELAVPMAVGVAAIALAGASI